MYAFEVHQTRAEYETRWSSWIKNSRTELFQDRMIASALIKPLPARYRSDTEVIISDQGLDRCMDVQWISAYLERG